ncbi:MAG: YbaN family protein [Paracoccaceae bacterium]
MRLVWLMLGCLSLAIGIVGVFLPLLPTVPFLLLAAIGFSRSSKRLHDWLLSHPIYGPPISRWQERGAISRRAKIVATLSIIAGVGAALLLGIRQTIIAIQIVVLAGSLLFIWTRPEE